MMLDEERVIRQWQREASAPAIERHYSLKEIASTLHLSYWMVRRMFQDEKGVLKLGKEDRRDGKRDYLTIRVPESVLLRVMRKHREV